MNKVYTFDDIATGLARKAAAHVSARYRRDGTFFDDALSDVYEWLYTPRHRAKVNRWLASTPQQTTRIFWSLVSAAQQPAERLRAERRGYDPDDVHFYSAREVRALLPLALNDDYDGNESPDRTRQEDLNEGVRKNPDRTRQGETLAAVVDIRRAIAGLPQWVGMALRGSEDYRPDAVAAIVDFLGSHSPWTVGRRRVMSNASAQALTGGEYDGE